MSAPVDISAQRCQRLVERLRLSASGSVTLHHTHYRRDCGDAADLILALRAALDAAERERDGANALVERMHAQDVLAIQAWQKAHPGQGPMWPSSIRLSAWCMGEVARLTFALATARADALREVQQGCPFGRESCDLEPEEPCPVCGDLGTLDDENLAKPSRCILGRTAQEAQTHD